MPLTPAVIAHRGACGYLPEHTLAAKAFAHALGVDYLEQDVIATRDGVLVVLHDIYLEHVTDVARVFPDRGRDDGHFYVVDFDLDELRRLAIHERRHPERDEALFPLRFPREPLGFPIVTLEEELEFIAGLNRSTGRDVGIYPEIKDPEWYFAHNTDLAHLLLTTLEAFGYSSPEHNAIVQCFDAAELRRVREQLGCRLKLVRLLDDEDALSRAALERIAEYADGIGLPYGRLIETPASGPAQANAVVATAHAAGLIVHPYTFRRDRLPDYADNAQEFARWLFADVGVDGLFCDHPDVALAARTDLALDSDRELA
jgi:glycerophosphoryl diester phosphodiesterase